MALTNSIVIDLSAVMKQFVFIALSGICSSRFNLIEVNLIY